MFGIGKVSGSGVRFVNIVVIVVAGAIERDFGQYWIIFVTIVSRVLPLLRSILSFQLLELALLIWV